MDEGGIGDSRFRRVTGVNCGGLGTLSAASIMLAQAACRSLLLLSIHVRGTEHAAAACLSRRRRVAEGGRRCDHEMQLSSVHRIEAPGH